MSDEIWSSIIQAGATVFAGLSVFFLSIKYQRNSQKIEEDKIAKELFKEFNERFDKINNKLLVITKLTDEEIKKLSKRQLIAYEGVVMDFFNICSEEFLWHKKGRIVGDVWTSWHRGMKDIYNKSSLIRKLWDEETANDGFKSYYLKKKEDLFTNSSR